MEEHPPPQTHIHPHIPRNKPRRVGGRKSVSLSRRERETVAGWGLEAAAQVPGGREAPLSLHRPLPARATGWGSQHLDAPTVGMGRGGELIGKASTIKGCRKRLLSFMGLNPEAPCKPTYGATSLVLHFPPSFHTTFQALSLCGPGQVDYPLCVSSFSFIKHKQKSLQNSFWFLLTALSTVHSFNNTFTDCQPPAKPGLNRGIYPWGEFILHKLHKCIISGQHFSFLTSKDLHLDPQEPSILPQSQPGVQLAFTSSLNKHLLSAHCVPRAVVPAIRINGNLIL